MQTTISNEFLTVTIDTHGAEVVSVKNSKGEELIWQADPTIWDRHSPVLFPWAGRLANGELIHNGKHYSGGQHGFIRDLEHILKQNNGISAQLMFRADEETKTLRFPFDFEFTSVFTLDGHTLHHEVHVKNCGDENMRCGIGFHPGFNIPFDENHTTTDYEIRFEQEESPIILDCLPHGLLSGKSFYQWKNTQAIPLTDTLLWSAPTKPMRFICIEPWQSLPAAETDTSEWNEHAAAACIAPNESYSITLHTTFER